MRKRYMIAVIGLGLIGFGGYKSYQFAMNLIGDKIATQLVAESASNPQWLEDVDLSEILQTTGEASPAVSANSTKPITTDATSGGKSVVGSKQANEEVKKGSESTDHQEAKAAPPAGKKELVAFSDKEEAVKFVMSRFTVSELNHLRQIASGGLTPTEKAELKKIAFAKFSSSEIVAVQKVVASQ
jgi:hypothetical protein